MKSIHMNLRMQRRTIERDSKLDIRRQRIFLCDTFVQRNCIRILLGQCYIGRRVIQVNVIFIQLCTENLRKLCRQAKTNAE